MTTLPLLNHRLVFLFTFFLLINKVSAQSKIDTDRPDQTESAFTIPKGWVQFEAGFNKQQNNKFGSEYFSPTLLSKYGLSSKLEFRLITTIITNSSLLIPQGNLSFTGLDPIQIGAKVSFWEAKKWIPKTSLIFHFGIPKTASKNFDIKKIAPNFRFTMQNELSKKVAIGYNLGAEWDGETNIPSYVYTFAPGMNISERWYGYIEAFGEIKKGESAQHSLDGGIAYYVTTDFKVDISSGFGISRSAPDWYMAIGASVRFNTRKSK